MGMFQVSVRVSNPRDPSRFFEAPFWVDTGALYSFVPEDRLNQIGIEPLRARDLILADGRRDRRVLGEAVLTIAQPDESLTCPVVFAPSGSLYLLGTAALENFGVQADPSTQRLKPIAALIGGFLASAPSSDERDCGIRDPSDLELLSVASSGTGRPSRLLKNLAT
jgi:predicted aspartyl protease